MSKSKLLLLAPVQPTESLRGTLTKLIADLDAGLTFDKWFLVVRGPNPDNPTTERYRSFNSGMTREQLLWALESAKYDLMREAKA